ncbi:hypothetical protein DLJ46_05725 [Micromonospora globispora]|uniref:Uncharacterized protein n=2 Tax=Micromonospora globispora TaxID=1450148 RepID=A0A317KCD6_9ACTN|nr:hypothetical protein DLJ46_05725 [Micromonospora globispora]RQW89679.1 hypothetical protein DKL51_23465 [Micromonospora globispora]
MTPAHDTSHAPTVQLSTIGGQPAGEPQAERAPTSPAGGLPRRTRESVRTESTPATGHRASPEDQSSPQSWPDETAAFAAGVSDAQATTDEGQLP